MINNDIHFHQSAAWETFQKALGRTVIHKAGEDWEYRAIIEPARFGLTRLYCPYGPYAKNTTALKEALTSLAQEGRKAHAAFLRIQPLGTPLTPTLTRQLGMQKTHFSQPSLTWRIATDQPKDALLGAMKQNNRNIYNTSEKHGLSYTRSNDPADLAHLLRLLHAVAQHNDITIHSDRYLTTQAESLMRIGAAHIHCVAYHDEVIAAALVYEDEYGYYYAHAASDYEHRKLNASTALLAHLIIEAHNTDKKFFDLYGVAPDDSSEHRWAGFTKFKKSFGGFAYPLSDTYEIPLKKVRYYAYRLARAAVRLIR